MRRKLLSLVMVISIGICAVGCGSNNANEVSTVATTEQTTTQEIIVAETTKNVKEETTTAKTYDYPTTVDDAEKEFGFTVDEADKFMTTYFANGDYMVEYPTTVLQHFDVNADNIFDQAEFENIRNWTYLFYDSKIEGVSNNNNSVDEIELMHIYNDYLINGIFTFDTVFEDDSEVGDLSEYLYYRNMSVGRAKSEEEGAKIYPTIKDAENALADYFNTFETPNDLIVFLNLDEDIYNYFDSNSDSSFSFEEFGNFRDWVNWSYNYIGNNNNIIDEYEFKNFCYDFINNSLILGYYLPDGTKWME